MIEYVDKLLKHWAQEMQADQVPGSDLGYPRSSWPFEGRPRDDQDGRVWSRPERETAQGTQSRRAPRRGGVGKVAETVDAAVVQLEHDLMVVVVVHYRQPDKTAREKAEFIGISNKTFWKRIHKAHVALSAGLPDSYSHWTGIYPQL